MIHILDDFYPNPMEVREEALKLFYYPGGKGTTNNFPGKRTVGTFSEENRLYCRNRLEKVIGSKLVDFPAMNSNCGFTLGMETDRRYKKGKTLNWIHNDIMPSTVKSNTEHGSTGWAAIVYMQPAADVSTGTGLFRNKRTDKIYATEGKMKGNENAAFFGEWKAKEGDKDWELHTYVGNIFNRCAVYPAHYWHAPFNAGFGYDKKTGRLVQVFFFNSEKTGE